MDLEGLFLNQQPLRDPSTIDLSNITPLTQRFDLSVYHLAYGTKPLRNSTIKRMMKRQNRINMKKAEKNIVLSPEERRKKGDKQKWLEKMLERAKKENLQFSQVLPNGRIQPKTKIVMKRPMMRNNYNHRRNIVLNGYTNKVISKPQSLVGQFGTGSKIVKINNSPFSKVDLPAAPIESFLKQKGKPIKGFGDDSEFPSLL